MSNKLFRLRYIITLTILIIFSIFPSCMQLRKSTSKIYKEFENLSYKPKVRTYEVGSREMRYVEVGDENKPLIIFIHGAPGSSQDFYNENQYLRDEELAKKVRMIAVDRPGYGYSDFGKTVRSIEEQAKLIKPLLELNKHKNPPILVGHSYGGPVIARLAMDYPELTGKLLFLAPALDPENEKIFFFNRPMNWIVFKWMLPTAMRVANDEKLSHKKELEKMKPLWEKMTNEATYVHGHKDWIVPIENSQFAVKMMSNAKVDTIFNDEMNHLIIWNKYDMVKKKILEMLEN